ncbi:MAG: DUF1772 domain-containing protein [Bacteroidota bacterium]
MEITMKSLTLYGAITLTGLSAGLFYAWAVSVIPGTLKVTDSTYLQTMQAINRAILNPAFYLSFFGSLILLGLATAFQFRMGTPFWLLLAATALYLVGTFGVTAFGNVPLNDQLDVLNLAELSPDRLQAFRQDYEIKWNRLHMIRTICSVASFLLALLTAFTNTNP